MILIKVIFNIFVRLFERDVSMDNKTLRKVPVKNYVILGIIVFVTMLFLYYFYCWVDAYKDSKINISILDKYMSVINYNELDNYLVENPDTIVYVSVLEDEVIRNFEKEFKNKFKDNEIDTEVLYLDITDEVNNKSVKGEIDSKYYLNNNMITDVPSLVVFKDGVVNSIYSIKENDYDIDRFVIYLNNIRLESDGL